ncbi:hypothetical protein OIE68_39755 [Nocardia vinacea]|uniref:hypothetical protein n=1 Tax=Nocardia vinacea TaxID=96468 RepID=UPI002E1605A7|nr:hypothetical protein OIE68_39755 [Nocardia vinacea]
MSRSVRISYDIITLPTPVGATTTGLLAQATTTSNTLPPTTVFGIGDDAITWLEQPKASPVRIGLRFRIGNLTVDVETSGQDWPGVPSRWRLTGTPQ